MESKFYKEAFSMLRGLTIRAVESMPADQIGYAPENSRSFADIALHCADAAYFFVNKVAGRDDKPAKAFTRENYPTREAIADALRDSQRYATGVLDALTPDDLARVMPTPNGSDGPAETFLSILCFHEADHKGNLVTMAKVHGANPPDVFRMRQEQAAKG